MTRRTFLASTLAATTPPALRAATSPAATPLSPPPVNSAAVLPPPAQSPTDFTFIDTSIENGSPLHWDFAPDGSIVLSLQYDHERASPNRASGHWHFRLEGRAGSSHTLVFQNFITIWNGTPVLPVDARTACLLSDDGRTWRSERMELIEQRVRLRVTLGPTGVLYVARVEPYRLSDLEKLITKIRLHPFVSITAIGRTVENRPLEIIRLGRENAPHRIFLRARAHPWEPGGNWIIEGLIAAVLADTPSARAHLEKFAYCILPIANKDGVAHGRTRFNLRGIDLNRGWDQPASAELCPENHALEQWLAAQSSGDARPHLALELHNDNNGKLHLSRPAVPELPTYLENMRRLEALLRRHTWFTEGSTGATTHNPGTLGSGWLERFGVTAAVLEFNAHWIAGKQKAPLGADWEEFGRALPAVFTAYFAPSP